MLTFTFVPAVAFSSAARTQEGRWTPARETQLDADHGGLSPVPTTMVHPNLGEMDLLKRYSVGANACGFVGPGGAWCLVLIVLSALGQVWHSRFLGLSVS